MKKFKLYLDACCFLRPFDDHSQDVVRLEAEAVEAILNRCMENNLLLISSEMIHYELNEDKDLDRKAAAFALEEKNVELVELDDDIQARANELVKLSIGNKDAVHLACAEKAGVDYFLTTDYPLLKKVRSITLSVVVLNPLEFIARELTHE